MLVKSIYSFAILVVRFYHVGIEDHGVVVEGNCFRGHLVVEQECPRDRRKYYVGLVILCLFVIFCSNVIRLGGYETLFVE